jgi:seryl-tRNA synthetase
MKIYNIKSSEEIYVKWMKLVAKTNKKSSSMFIMQNDMEATTEELNNWFKDSQEEIIKVDEDFKQIVSDLLALREETVKYIKAQINKQEASK